jgi:hypothetical protein
MCFSEGIKGIFKHRLLNFRVLRYKHFDINGNMSGLPQRCLGMSERKPMRHFGRNCTPRRTQIARKLNSHKWTDEY